MPNSFERVLLIVNPTAQNGRAAQAAVFAAERLRGRLEADSVVVRETEYAKHAIELAREARGFDLVLSGWFNGTSIYGHDAALLLHGARVA